MIFSKVPHAATIHGVSVALIFAVAPVFSVAPIMYATKLVGLENLHAVRHRLL